MKAVTHNIVHTLKLEPTERSVARALASRPQIVSFQEFDSNDQAALLKHGRVVDRHSKRIDIVPPSRYLICTVGAGGLPVLLRRRYVKAIHNIELITVAPPHDGVRTTPGTVVRFKNRHNRNIAVLNTHPVAHLDRPNYKNAHEVAVKFIIKWAEQVQKEDYLPFVMMDGNGVTNLQGLINCWDGHAKLPTGPGGHTIDAIWTLRNSDLVDTFGSPSDHNGVVATYRHL